MKNLKPWKFRNGYGSSDDFVSHTLINEININKMKVPVLPPKGGTQND